jgi:putative endonuclease
MEGFSCRYHVHQLVYFQQTSDIYSAIAEEKRIKKWRRSRKLRLIESSNPLWVDLYDEI